MKFAERLMARLTGRRSQRLLGFSAAATLAVSAVVSLVVVPADATQGNVQRLMYVHVPAAWLAYVSFTTVFIASIGYLKTKQIRWDRLAAASVEIGVLFTALTILLGSLWGKPVWGTYWTWDPRLTTTAILLLVYVGYLALRQVADNPARRARWSAVVGIVAFLDVPIVHLSVVWWRSLHQQATVLRPGAPTIAGSMLATLLLSFVAMNLLYLYLLALRLRVGRLEDRVAMEALSGRLRSGPSERSVTSPVPMPLDVSAAVGTSPALVARSAAGPAGRQ